MVRHWHANVWFQKVEQFWRYASERIYVCMIWQTAMSEVSEWVYLSARFDTQQWLKCVCECICMCDLTDSNEWSECQCVFVSMIWHIAVSEASVWVYLYVWFDRQQWVKEWMHKRICTHELTHTNGWISEYASFDTQQWVKEWVYLYPWSAAQ